MQTTKRNKNNLICRLLYIFMIVLYASCGSGNVEQPEDPTLGDDGIHVSIQLSGQPGELTRSETDEYGSAADNYINYKDLYVMTFSLKDDSSVLSDESELIEVMWHPNYTNSSYNGKSTVSSSGENVYLIAQLNKVELEYEKNFCIVAVANIGSFNQSLTLNQLTKGVTFKTIKDALHSDYKPSGVNTMEWNWHPDNTKGIGIPMFGVKKVNLKGYDSKIFSAWNPYELHSNDGNKDLKLLRAFTKVVVKFKDDFVTPTGQTDVKFITGGGIGKNYSGGFKVIPTLGRMKDFSSKGETNEIISVNSDDIISNLSNGTLPTADLQFSASPDGKYAYLYIPEYDLGTYEPNNPDLTVMIAFGGIPQSFTFKFKQYKQDASSMDIPWRYLLRNYCYCFTIDIEYGKIFVVATDWDNSYDNEFNFG